MSGIVELNGRRQWNCWVMKIIICMSLIKMCVGFLYVTHVLNFITLKIAYWEYISTLHYDNSFHRLRVCIVISSFILKFVVQYHFLFLTFFIHILEFNWNIINHSLKLHFIMQNILIEVIVFFFQSAL